MKSATQTLPASSRVPKGCPRWSVSVKAGRVPRIAGEAPRRG